MVVFFVSLLEGDVEKVSDFQGGKYVRMVAFFSSPLGGVVEKISHLLKKDRTAPRRRRLSRRVISGKGLKQKSEFFA